MRVDYKPYVEWWHRPFRGTYLTIDERGLRRTPGECGAGSQAVRILCFGGSTMMGMGARDEETIPAVLSRRLAEFGHRVAITNFGQLGHNSTQELITLQQLLKSGERFDIALFYDGINEMACAEQTGRADRLFNEARRRAEFNLLHWERRRELLIAALMTAAPRSMRRLRQWTGLPLRGPLPAAEADLSRIDIPRLAGEVVAVYAANLRLIRLLAHEYGFEPVFFWQPVITTKRRKTPDEQRWENDYTIDPARRRQLYERSSPSGAASLNLPAHRTWSIYRRCSTIGLSLFTSIFFICRRREMQRLPKQCCLPSMLLRGRATARPTP